jgi:hypothetical protein
LATTLEQWQTARGLARAFARFERVTVVRVGSLDIPPRIEARLRAAATEVVIHPVGTPGPLDVSPLGLDETGPAERLLQVALSTARTVLGPYAAPMRARLRALLRR